MRTFSLSLYSFSSRECLETFERSEALGVGHNSGARSTRRKKGARRSRLRCIRVYTRNERQEAAAARGLIKIGASLSRDLSALDDTAEEEDANNAPLARCKASRGAKKNYSRGRGWNKVFSVSPEVEASKVHRLLPLDRIIPSGVCCLTAEKLGRVTS